jgi:hypothetical protein
MSVKYEYVVKRPDSKPEIEVWQNDAQRQSYLGRSRLWLHQFERISWPLPHKGAL